MKNQKQFNSGFTLIELLAVMAIIAIMLAFALPSVFTFNDEADHAKLDSQTSAIYKIVSSKAVATLGNDVTQVFDLTTNRNFFELQNISDDEVIFCFSLDVDVDNIEDVATTDVTGSMTISQLQAANQARFIIIIPITDTNQFDITQDIVILQPGSDVMYVNGLKDFR